MNIPNNTNLYKFIELLTARLNEYKADNGFTYFDNYNVHAKAGSKYIKILKSEMKDNRPTNSGIVAFVDKNTGDIFKPATYQAPAAHSRGNINSDQNGMEAIDENGFVKYLR